MRYVFIFLALIGLVVILIKLTAFIVLKIKINEGYPVFVKLANYKTINWLQLGGSIVSVVAGIVFYIIYELDYILFIWGAIAFFQLVNAFISPKNCLLLSKKGMRMDLNKRFLKWEFIKSVNINFAANYQLTVLYGKKNIIIDCGNRQTMESMILGVKKIREDVYKKHFAGF